MASMDESLVAIVPSQNGSGGLSRAGPRLIVFPCCHHGVLVTKFHGIVESLSKLHHKTGGGGGGQVVSCRL